MEQPESHRVPLAFVNYRYVPLTEAAVPIWDWGFLQGVSVTERLRTLRRELWQVESHLDRLLLGLELCSIPAPYTREELADIAREVASQNLSLLPAKDELSLSLAVTAGDHLALGPGNWGLEPASSLDSQHRSRLVVYGCRLPQELLADGYRCGLRAKIASNREIPSACLDRRIKSRSRLHYWLAEREASADGQDRKAILLDLDGYLAEGTTGTVVMLEEDGRALAVPAADQILPGVTLGLLEPIAAQLGLAVRHRNISVDELMRAPEVLWLGTSPICQSIVEIDGKKIGAGIPGPISKALLQGFLNQP